MGFNLQTKLEVSPFLGIVPNAIDIGTRLKELLEKKEQLVSKLDRELAEGSYTQNLVVSYYLLEKELQFLREQLLLRSEDTLLGKDYIKYQDTLKARLPKGDLYLLEESQKSTVIPYLMRSEPFYDDYVNLLELAAQDNVELYLEVFLSNNKVTLVYEFGSFQRAISLEEGREGVDCTQLVLPYLERRGLTNLVALSKVPKSAICGYMYTSIVDEHLTPNMSYTKLNLTPQLISTIRFYASDYVEFGMDFPTREIECKFLIDLGFVTLPYIRYNLESGQTIHTIVEDWVSSLEDLADVSALSTNLRVSVVSHHSSRFKEFGFDSVVVNPILWSVNPQKAKLQYIHWKQTLEGLKPSAVISYLDVTSQLEVQGKSYNGFYAFATSQETLLNKTLDLGVYTKNNEDLGVEVLGDKVLELLLDSPLDILVLGLKPESSIYFWSAPELGITTVCDSLGRTVNQLLRK